IRALRARAWQRSGIGSRPAHCPQCCQGNGGQHYAGGPSGRRAGDRHAPAPQRQQCRTQGMKRRTVISLALAGALSGLTRRSFAQERGALLVMGTAAPDIMAGLIAALSQRPEGAGADIRYQQARPAQIISLLSSQTEAATLPHLVLLPTPDLAVQLAN